MTSATLLAEVMQIPPSVALGARRLYPEASKTSVAAHTVAHSKHDTGCPLSQTAFTCQTRNLWIRSCVVAGATSAAVATFSQARHTRRRRKRPAVRAARSVAAASVKESSSIAPEYDVVVIGAGLGGLACAGALARAGRRVAVLEAHTVCGGCAHAFTRKAKGGGEYIFDSGPSIVTEMSKRNPLRQVMDYLGASDDVEWIDYDGWSMLTPEGPWKLQIGPAQFRDEILPKYGVSTKEFDEVLQASAPLAQVGQDIPGLVLRDDEWQLLPLLLKFPGGVVPAIRDAATLSEPFSVVLDKLEDEGKLSKGSWLRKWLDALAFSLSGLDCTGTTAAAMAFTVEELHRQGAGGLAYPKGGMGSVVEALVSAVERAGGEVHTNVRVEEILLEGRRAVGVRCAGVGQVRAREAVVCNASVWDSAGLLPTGAGAAIEDIQEDWKATPMTRSYLHLHVGLDAEGLDLGALQPHYTSMESWDDVTAEQNMVAISNPALLDPSLCPPGKLVFHLYCAGNEPYDIWKVARDKGKDKYKQLKEERSARLWRALESIIPDARDRAEVAMVGSPITHQRYLSRAAGTYGPAPIFGRFGTGKLPFRTARDASFDRGEDGGVEQLLLCGDSTFPGIGVPAAVVSGLSAAHTTLSVWEHLDLLGKAGY